jgi:chromosome segregation protein
VSLTKLELVGFKSFMAPISLEFKPGITAIMGPNGCGKTNIVDAVRWVLGEQSARQLRGSKMENVIFNGTQQHKPMGYASVNLTINNERGQFPLDYSEITIARKVYRSGVSEYFINKMPCRLKDIRDLFADTGTGSHSYSVIEQEMIDWVLNDLHGERRLMFEEAAGIVKYRMRREEAQRKLELTDADLLRLEDILEELRSQVRSLKYQMAKARRYQIVRDRIRSWEVVSIRAQLSGMIGGRRAAEAELTECLTRSRSEDDSLAELERKVEEARAAHLELERRRTELQNNRYDIRRRIQSSEEKVIQFTERESQARIRVERASREIGEAEGRLAHISERVAEVTGLSASTEAKIGADEGTLGALEEDFRALAERIQSLAARLIEMKQTQLDFLQDQARVKNTLEHFEGMLAELDGRSAETRERVSETEREGRGLAAEREVRAAACRELEERGAALDRERSGLVDSIQEQESRIFERERLLAEKRAELAHLKSKHDLLRRMKDNFEGFPGGAREVLTSGDSRVRGPLVEFLKVEDRYRPACEAVLAGLLDGVVIDRFAGALDLAREIAERKPGRVRLFAEDAPRAREEAATGDVPGCLGALASFVAVDDSRKGLVENLLRGAYVFEDAAAAIDFLSSDPGRDATAVTLSGVAFSSSAGIYVAGGGTEEFSLLGRTDDIERIGETISALEREVAELTVSCEEERSARENLQAHVRELEGEIQRSREELAMRREELQSCERDHATRREKASLLLRTLDEIERSRSEILAKLEEMRLSLRMQEESGEARQATDIETELGALRKRKEDIEAALTEKKIALASLRGALDKDREELKGLAVMENEFRGIAGERRREIAESEAELAQLAAALEGERSVARTLLEEERSFERGIDELAGSLEERRIEAEAAEKELKARAAERERIFERLNEIKIAISTFETQMRGLVEKAREMYAADLGCYLEGTELPLTDEEAAVTKEMLDREKKKLDSIGPVNLAAVEEFNEKKTRLDFLEAQKADLIKAKEELGEAIAKINERARSQFLETYNAVRTNFQETFRILFEGGEADLALSEAADPLEADIVITARPKGKRLQDISLLSGGERALTALALLFALYKAKPSPFCIFDEVDAPLDDANIQRLLRMLQVFKQDTQFIIITHNKRTMEVAETLYGITMEERGVSRVVSVDFDGIEKVLRNRAASERVLLPSEASSN